MQFIALFTVQNNVTQFGEIPNKLNGFYKKTAERINERRQTYNLFKTKPILRLLRRQLQQKKRLVLTQVQNL